MKMLMVFSWDDWVPQDRLRKFTEENKELAQDLKREMDDSRARAAPKSTSTKKKTAGSDFSSARGSEERHSSLPVTGRGSKRGRDTEIEKVGDDFYFCSPSSPCPDLESDTDTSDFGRSGASFHAITPDVELQQPVFACYDGGGDEPPRRSERKHKPKAVFEQKPPPAPQSKRQKRSPKGAKAIVKEAAASSNSASVSKANESSTRSDSIGKGQPAAPAAPNDTKPTVSPKPPSVSKGTESTTHGDTVEEGQVAAPVNHPTVGTDTPSDTAASTVEAPVAPNDAKPTASSNPPSVSKVTESSTRGDPVDEGQAAAPVNNPTEGTDAPSDTTSRTVEAPAASDDRKPTAEPDRTKLKATTAVEVTTTAVAAPSHAENDSSSSSNLTPPPASVDEATPPSVKRAVKSRGQKPAPKGKGKGAKGKAKASSPKTSNKSSTPPKSQTPLEYLEVDPPLDVDSKKPKIFSKPSKPEKPLSERELKAQEEAKLGLPTKKANVFIREQNRYRDEWENNYFYAGIPADMDRKPRKRMGPPKVSDERVKWMKFRKEQKRKGLSRKEINEKWIAILASEEKRCISFSSQVGSIITEVGAGYKSSTSETSGAAKTTTTRQADESSSSSQSHTYAPGGASNKANRGSSAPPLGSRGSSIPPQDHRASSEPPQCNSGSFAPPSREDVRGTTTNPGSLDAFTAQSSQATTSTDAIKSPISSKSSGKKRKASSIDTDQPKETQEPSAPILPALHPHIPPRGESPPKRARKNNNNKKQNTQVNPQISTQEETFNLRPAVRLPISDHLKALLVDDWEAVTKNLSLVPLPSAHPVTEILTAYLEEERTKRRAGSAEADLLEEVVAGVKEYFNQCLGRILLYRFEREQYFEVRKLWDEGKSGWEGKGAADAYGAEHLSRLFGMSVFYPHSLAP